MTALLYATIFGNVTTIFQQMYSTTGKYHETGERYDVIQVCYGVTQVRHDVIMTSFRCARQRTGKYHEMLSNVREFMKLHDAEFRKH